jgi:excisionase family DNA binding protein
MRDVIHNFKNLTERVTNHGAFQPVSPPVTPLLTLDQVAARLGVSREWVRDHATRRQPRIPVIRLGGRRALLRFRPEDVNKFIESNLLSGQEAPQ